MALNNDAAGEAKTRGSSAATDDSLVLGASKKGQQRRTGRQSDWTPAMADRFIEVLADSCNVSVARTIRQSISNVYKHRSQDASFRRDWDQTLAIGYSKLETMMLERGLHGVEKTVTLRNGDSRIMRDYNDRVALALLRQHRDAVEMIEAQSDEDEYREACEMPSSWRPLRCSCDLMWR